MLYLKKKHTIVRDEPVMNAERKGEPTHVDSDK